MNGIPSYHLIALQILQRRIIAETGFWVAIFDDADTFHASAITTAESIQEPLITTLPVLTEVCSLQQRRLGQQYALRFFRRHSRQAFWIFEMREIHIERCLVLMLQ